MSMKYWLQEYSRHKMKNARMVGIYYKWLNIDLLHFNNRFLPFFLRLAHQTLSFCQNEVNESRFI